MSKRPRGTAKYPLRAADIPVAPKRPLICDVHLRLPVDILTWLRDGAAKNGRSVTQESMHWLRWCMAEQRKNP